MAEKVAAAVVVAEAAAVVVAEAAAGLVAEEGVSAVVIAEAAAVVVAEAAAGIVAEEGVSATAGWVAEEVSRCMCPPPMLRPRRTGIRQTACFVQGTHSIQKLKESMSPE